MCFGICRCLCADVYFSDHLCDHYHAAYGSAPLKKTGEKVYQEALENHARRVEERGAFALEETKLPKGKENNTVPKRKRERKYKKEKTKATGRTQTGP